MNEGILDFPVKDFKDGEFSADSKTAFYGQDIYDFPAFFKWMNGIRPVLYVGAFHPQYMSPNSPQENVIVNFFLNYFGTGSAATNTSASNKTFRKYKGNSWVFWNNGVSAATTWGTADELNFMHNPKAEFTLFFVWKNLINETSGTSIVPFANSNSTGQRGHIMAMFDNGNFKTPTFRIDAFSGGNSAVTHEFPVITKSKDYPPIIYSIRVKDIHNSTGTKIGQSYVDGKFYKDIILDNPFSTGNASNVFRIGQRPSGDLSFRGYFGELLIFDRILSEEVHTQIIYHLKLKYKI